MTRSILRKKSQLETRRRNTCLQSTALPGLIVGIFAGVALLVIGFFFKPLHDLIYRDSIAHLFPLTKFLWYLAPLLTPNEYSSLLVTLFVLSTTTLTGYIVYSLFLHKKKTAALLLLLCCVLLLIMTFWILSIPIDHTQMNPSHMSINRHSFHV